MSRSTETVEKTFDFWGEGGGIFNALQSYEVPWQNLTISDVLDNVYFGNISGEKIISPFVRKIKSGDTLTSQEVGKIAKTIYNLYDTKWDKEWDTMLLQYDPIENYSMTEQMTNDTTTTDYGHINTRVNDLTHTKTGTETQEPDLTDTLTLDTAHGKTGTETQEPDLTETQTPNTTDTTTNTVYGFNSSSAVNSSGETLVKSGTDTTTKTGTDTLTFDTSETDTGTHTTTKEGTDTLTFDTSETDTGDVTDTESGRDTHTRNYKLTRSGNIGVTTSQQMIESERALWNWDYFYSIVFPDVDKVLSLGVY